MSETTDALTLVAGGDEYELFASGDNASFVLIYKTDQMTANIGGEDAIRFRADLEETKQSYPDYSADQMLAQLWDQGGYSWLASQEG